MIRWVELRGRKKKLAAKQLKDIFFLSTDKVFTSRSEKQEFFDRWTSYYFSHHPDLIFLKFDEQNDLLGYLMGCLHSDEALGHYENSLPSYKVFADLFSIYPAHFHINFHPRARGLGLGTSLLQCFIGHCRERGVKGIHLVTAPGARNVSFYKNLGFELAVDRDFAGHPLLFLGRSLIPRQQEKQISSSL